MTHSESVSTTNANKSASIVARVCRVNDVSEDKRRRLLELMCGHFENVDERQFFRDLDEKRSVILMEESTSGRIVGFATMTVLTTTLGDQPIAAVFAGDTVLEPAYWGHHAWIGVWVRHAYELAATSGCETVYFLLLTSTHRSYRFLRGFFRDYYPRPGHELPAELRERRDALTRLKFPDEYDAASGLVRLQHSTPVRADRHDPAVNRASTDVDIQYFLMANPAYQRGDFLVCITEYSLANMTPVGQRLRNSTRPVE